MIVYKPSPLYSWRAQTRSKASPLTNPDIFFPRQMTQYQWNMHTITQPERKYSQGCCTVYLLVRIIFLITLLEAMGTEKPPALFKAGREPCFWGWPLILWHHVISFFFFFQTTENLSWGKWKIGWWWLALAGWSSVSLIMRRQLCARSYCPLGARLRIICAGSGRWLLQLQH